MKKVLLFLEITIIIYNFAEVINNKKWRIL